MVFRLQIFVIAQTVRLFRTEEIFEQAHHSIFSISYTLKPFYAESKETDATGVAFIASVMNLL